MRCTSKIALQPLYSGGASHGFTGYIESQETKPNLDAIPDIPESGDVPDATSASTTPRMAANDETIP